MSSAENLDRIRLGGEAERRGVHLPGRRPCGEASDPTHTGGGLGSVGIDRQRRWRVVVLDVEQVEGLEAQLQVPSFVNGDGPEQGEVQIDYMRPSERVATQVSECASVVGDSESAGIEPTR